MGSNVKVPNLFQYVKVLLWYKRFYKLQRFWRSKVTICHPQDWVLSIPANELIHQSVAEISQPMLDFQFSYMHTVIRENSTSFGQTVLPTDKFCFAEWQINNFSFSNRQQIGHLIWKLTLTLTFNFKFHIKNISTTQHSQKSTTL